MNKSQSIKSLSEALAKAQAEMPAVKMNAVNPFLKNHFADLGAVIETTRPILAKNGLSISQFPTSQNGSIGVTTVLSHTSGEWLEDTITMPLSEEKGKSAAQVAGSIITYLRRYSWSGVLGLYADEDTDGSTPKTRTVTEEAPKKVEKVVIPQTEARKRHGEKWALAMKANLLDKDTVKEWSVTPKDTDEQVEAKIALIEKALEGVK